MDKRNITSIVADLVQTVPPEIILDIIPALEFWDEHQDEFNKSQLIASILNPAIKSKVDFLLIRWKDINPELPKKALALTIQAALISFQSAKSSSLELIWTGPGNLSSTVRRTDQALLELINGATTRLMIVSFAVYKAQAIIDAIEKALRRNVEVLIVLEDSNESQGKLSVSGIKAFSNNVFRLASFFTWPIENRPHTIDGKYGSLHAKLAVADRKKVFISSANLTDYAMDLNIEVGVIVEDTSMGHRIDCIFTDMIINSILIPAGK